MARPRRKPNTQLLLLEETRDAVRALAAATGRVRAEIMREMIVNQVSVWEKRHAAEMAELDTIAERFGMSRTELVDRLIEDGLYLRHVRGAETYNEAFVHNALDAPIDQGARTASQTSSEDVSA